jgi:hypothetical protein
MVENQPHLNGVTAGPQLAEKDGGVVLIGKAKKTIPPKIKQSKHTFVLDKGDVQPDCHRASTSAREWTYSSVVVDGDSQTDKLNDQPAPLFMAISGGVEDNSTMASTHANTDLMIVKEATLECVLIGATVEETLTSNNIVDPYVVDVSSTSLDVCKQPEESPSDKDWK